MESGIPSTGNKPLKEFEQRILNPVEYIQNADGTRSTHKMASAGVDGKQIAFPTIIKKDGKLQELGIDAAIDYAIKTGEYKEFKTEKEAQDYAEGGYKRGTPMEKDASYPHPSVNTDATLASGNTITTGSGETKYKTPILKSPANMDVVKEGAKKHFLENPIFDETQNPNAKKNRDIYAKEALKGYSQKDIIDLKNYGDFINQNKVAIQDSQEKLKADPSNPVLNTALGHSLMNIGDYENAIPALEKTLKDPSKPLNGIANSKTFTDIGYAYAATKDPSRANTYFQDAIKADPSNPEPQKALASFANQAGNKELADSLTDNVRQLEIDKTKQMALQESDPDAKLMLSKKSDIMTFADWAAKGKRAESLEAKDNDLVHAFASGLDFSEEYIGKFIDGMATGAKKVGEGAVGYSMNESTGEFKIYDEPTKELMKLNGLVEMGFSLMRIADAPTMALFDIGTDAASKTLPENISKFVLQPGTLILDSVTTKDEQPDWAKQLAASGDVIGSLLVFHGLGVVGKKFKANEALTGEETKAVVEALKATTPEELKKAIDSVEHKVEDKPDKLTALEAEKKSIETALQPKPADEPQISPVVRKSYEEALVSVNDKIAQHHTETAAEAHKKGIDAIEQDGVNEDIKNIDTEIAAHEEVVKADNIDPVIKKISEDKIKELTDKKEELAKSTITPPTEIKAEEVPVVGDKVEPFVAPEVKIDEPIVEDNKPKKEVKPPKLSPKEKIINSIHDLITQYNELKNGRLGKDKPEGKALRLKIEQEALKNGFKVDGKKVLKLKNEKGRTLKPNYRDIGNKALNEDYIPLEKRSEKTQEIFNKLNDIGENAFPVIKDMSGKRMSKKQLKGAIDDVVNDRPTNAAHELLSQLDEQINDGHLILRGEGVDVSVPLDEYFKEEHAEEQEPLDAEQISIGEKEYDDWFNSLTEEQKQEELKHTEHENESKPESGTKSPENDGDKPQQEDNQTPSGEPTEPTETLRAKEIKKLIDDATDELSAAENSFKEKAKALDKELLADQENLFGERKTDGGMFDERADASMRDKALEPFKERVRKAKEALKDLNDKLKEESDKSEKDLFDQAAKKKAYQDTAGLTPNTQTGRIPVDPIIGYKPKSIKNIILDVTKGIKQKLFFSKPGRRRATGTYSPGSSAIKIRYNGDLDVTAHEIGHSMDDLFGVLDNIPHSQQHLVDTELANFWEHGSEPPKHLSAAEKLNYKRAEGFAEWLRAFIVNPNEAIARAPELYKLYESKVHPEYKKALTDFSMDIRTFAGSSGRDMVLSNIEYKPEDAEGLIKKIFGTKNKDGFSISWAEKVAAQFIDPLTALRKAFEYAKGIKGIDEVLPSEDPNILSRLLLGVDGKIGHVLEKGMIDADNNVLKDADGNVKNLNWLLEPFDNTDQSTIERDMQDTMAYMVAERTVELSKKFNRSNVLSGIGGGIFRDIDIAKKTLDEFTKGDPLRLERIKKAAGRYREFSDDLLKYMVDKGRLAEALYDKDGNLIGGYKFIKENNLQYVAMKRIGEMEPGRELETGVGKSLSLASKTDIIKKIKGSTKTIINPYISLIDNIYNGMRDADRNEVLVPLRNMLTESRAMHQGDVKAFSEVGVAGKPGDKNAITIFVDGKPEHWIFQEDVYKALKGLDAEVYRLPAIVTALPKLLRWTVTNFPVFALRNIARDMQDRVIKTDSKSGFKDVIGDKKHWDDIARNGGLNAGNYMKSRESYYGLLEVAMKDLSKDKKFILADATMLKQGWKGYQNLLSKSETVNRVAEYRAAFREAKSKGLDDYNASLHAAFKARDLTDFALMGHYMKVINQLIPFSNAAVQGLRKSVLSAKNDPAGFGIRLMAYTVTPQVALWALNHKDDETAAEYESLPSYQRDMFWNFKIGKNNWVSIPKPFELGMPASSIDRTLSRVFANNKKAFEGYGGSVSKSILPVDEGNFSGPYQGVVEGYANYDFFRNKSIVPPHENSLDLALRNTENASRLGKAVQEVSGIDARKIDHFVRSQFSYFGGLTTKISDIGAESGYNKFGLQDLGFFKQTPAYNSVQVQKLMEFAQKWNLTQSREYGYFNDIAKQYFQAKTDSEKDTLAKTLREYAKSQLDEWEADGIDKEKIEEKKDKDEENKP